MRKGEIVSNRNKRNVHREPPQKYSSTVVTCETFKLAVKEQHSQVQQKTTRMFKLLISSEKK
ncbi:CLUMA_CG009386, isoform A [Clunio marinus]|uniref:CLUMA_CG009386, isoform A n=1 Tax=Clunio marinus TaxID=568069 RepID=A0A1J1IAF8_9DIPT|nr:CLUMA_CG009386, isoform A [Clunio marinus]